MNETETWFELSDWKVVQRVLVWAERSHVCVAPLGRYRK
jgi:hypothetical protein